MSIIEQGYKAFMSGKSEENNPYKYGTQEYIWWEAGFIEAMTEN